MIKVIIIEGKNSFLGDKIPSKSKDIQIIGRTSDFQVAMQVINNSYPNVILIGDILDNLSSKSVKMVQQFLSELGDKDVLCCCGLMQTFKKYFNERGNITFFSKITIELPERLVNIIQTFYYEKIILEETRDEKIKRYKLFVPNCRTYVENTMNEISKRRLSKPQEYLVDAICDTLQNKMQWYFRREGLDSGKLQATVKNSLNIIGEKSRYSKNEFWDVITQAALAIWHSSDEMTRERVYGFTDQDLRSIWYKRHSHPSDVFYRPYKPENFHEPPEYICMRIIKIVLKQMEFIS